MMLGSGMASSPMWAPEHQEAMDSSDLIERALNQLCSTAEATQPTADPASGLHDGTVSAASDADRGAGGGAQRRTGSGGGAPATSRKLGKSGGSGPPRPHTKKGQWSEEEEMTLATQHREVGNKWSAISKFLPLRSDNDVKNHWNSTLRSKSQIKHTTFLWLYAKEVESAPDDVDVRARCFERALGVHRRLHGLPEPEAGSPQAAGHDDGDGDGYRGGGGGGTMSGGDRGGATGTGSCSPGRPACQDGRASPAPGAPQSNATQETDDSQCPSSDHLPTGPDAGTARHSSAVARTASSSDGAGESPGVVGQPPRQGSALTPRTEGDDMDADADALLLYQPSRRQATGSPLGLALPSGEPSLDCDSGPDGSVFAAMAAEVLSAGATSAPPLPHFLGPAGGQHAGERGPDSGGGLVSTSNPWQPHRAPALPAPQGTTRVPCTTALGLSLEAITLDMMQEDGLGGMPVSTFLTMRSATSMDNLLRLTGGGGGAPEPPAAGAAATQYNPSQVQVQVPPPDSPGMEMCTPLGMGRDGWPCGEPHGFGFPHQPSEGPQPSGVSSASLMRVMSHTLGGPAAFGGGAAQHTAPGPNHDLPGFMPTAATTTPDMLQRAGSHGMGAGNPAADDWLAGPVPVQCSFGPGTKPLHRAPAWRASSFTSPAPPPDVPEYWSGAQVETWRRPHLSVVRQPSSDEGMVAARRAAQAGRASVDIGAMAMAPGSRADEWWGGGGGDSMQWQPLRVPPGPLPAGPVRKSCDEAFLHHKRPWDEQQASGKLAGAPTLRPAASMGGPKRGGAGGLRTTDGGWSAVEVETQPSRYNPAAIREAHPFPSAQQANEYHAGAGFTTGGPPAGGSGPRVIIHRVPATSKWNTAVAASQGWPTDAGQRRPHAHHGSGGSSGGHSTARHTAGYGHGNY